MSARDGGRMGTLKSCSEDKSSLVGRVWGGIFNCPLCLEEDMFKIILISLDCKEIQPIHPKGNQS